MSTQRVLVTFSAPQTFLSTEHWKQLYSALLTQSPLRNLHWKSVSRPTIRTIQELDVDFVAADALRNDHKSQIPQTLLEKPLLNMYIVICEDSETYKNTVKKQIKDWHSSIALRKDQEWLILHVVRPDAKSNSGRIFQMKASVLDKIKADFNIDKRDRCVQLAWSSDIPNPTAWADYTNKLKDGILLAFDAAVAQREEEVKRSEGQRQMPGWNFCTFFILKECLANSFEGMNLFEDAYQYYDELEDLFFQVLKEKNLSWFGALITPSPKDDSLPLLSATKKAYRDLILANTISVFDFRSYLLARECALLSKMGRVVQVSMKSVAFLGAFGRRLREVEDTLPQYFLESWMYSSALSVVDQCDVWATGLELDKRTQAAFNAAKGELLELARHQLDILGIRINYLPSKPPFSIALPMSSASFASDKHTSQSISQEDLLSALVDRESFYDLYVKLTNRAIEMYAQAGRRKFALKLHGNLAALDVFRDRLSNALQTYVSLPAHYAPHGWTSLETFMLSRALETHISAERDKDRDWLHVALEFLKAYVQTLGKELLIDEDDHEAYVTSLVKSVREAASGVSSALPYPDHPAISIAVSSKHARLSGDRDGALLDIIVHNHLPCCIPIDEVDVTLAGREGARLLFTAAVGSLSPGQNKLELFCPSAVSGTYTLDSSEIKISLLLLKWQYPKPTISAKSLHTLDAVNLVHITRDLHALDVRLRQPQCIELGMPSQVVVALNSGRNEITKVEMKLSAPSGVQFSLAKATLVDDSGLKHTKCSSDDTQDRPNLHAMDENITLTDIGSRKTILIAIPHSDASAFHAMRVNINVCFVTSAEPNITRNLCITRVVATSLPVAINVEDFFRGTRLFTRFTLASTTHQHVRIRSTRLRIVGEGSAGIKISNSISHQPKMTTITPAQPGRFLFQLDSTSNQTRGSLHLQITFRMLREEVESLINMAVDQAVEATPSMESHRDLLVDKLVQALESDASWVELYGVTGELIIPEISDEEGDISSTLLDLKQTLGRSRPDFSFGDWREIIIPVDVPQMHILAATRLEISPDERTGRVPPLFAGQPISATLTVSTSFHWAPAEDSQFSRYLMRFDVEEMTKDWLVSGRKRGEFVAKDDESFVVPITLIALHHGELSLPKIGITALPLPGELRMRSTVTPSCETYQMHGAEKFMILPRGGRSTYVVNMGDDSMDR